MKRMYEGSNFGRQGAVPGSDGLNTKHKNGPPGAVSDNTRRTILSDGARQGKVWSNHTETSRNTRDGLGGRGAAQGKHVRQPK